MLRRKPNKPRIALSASPDGLSLSLFTPANKAGYSIGNEIAPASRFRFDAGHSIGYWDVDPDELIRAITELKEAPDA